jgi:hypothetical protein
MGRIYNIAIFGAGGLGKAAAEIISMKKEFMIVGICDSKGFAYNVDKGLDFERIKALHPEQSVCELPEDGFRSDDPILELIVRSEMIDGIFMALPNLPNEFIPNVVKKCIKEGFKGVIVDALKRSSAVEALLTLDEELQSAGICYITGAGATPGLLTAAASLASHSFVDIEKIEIYFGVGIANWDKYKATIREDIAHLPGFSVEKAKAMTDEEIEEELKKRNWKLELKNMEHADDIILEFAGVTDRKKVSVGGVVDTRSPKKPVQTHVKITGKTFEGKTGTHIFALANETSMAANVIGPALGYMKTGFWLYEKGIYGIFTSAELMPRTVK